MKSCIALFLLLILPLPGWGQAPGFRKLYNGASTGAAFADLLWDGEKLIVAGQFLTDTAPGNALNGLLYLELDTNGNVQQTDLYFYPNDALTPDIQNSIFQSATGRVYAMSQIFYRVSKVKLFPNPVTDVLTVENPIGATLTPFNSMGRQVLQTDVQGSLQMVNLSALPSGIYWLRMQEQAIRASYLVVKR